MYGVHTGLVCTRSRLRTLRLRTRAKLYIPDWYVRCTYRSGMYALPFANITFANESQTVHTGLVCTVYIPVGYVRAPVCEHYVCEREQNCTYRTGMYGVHTGRVCTHSPCTYRSGMNGVHSCPVCTRSSCMYGVHNPFGYVREQNCTYPVQVCTAYIPRSGVCALPCTYPVRVCTRARPQVREHWHHTISRQPQTRHLTGRGSVSQSCLEGSEKHLVRLRARADSMIHPHLVDPRVLARGPTL